MNIHHSSPHDFKKIVNITLETTESVSAFINSAENGQKRKDSYRLKYDSGDEGVAPVLGFHHVKLPFHFIYTLIPENRRKSSRN